MQSTIQNNWYRQALVTERIRYASTLVDDKLIKEAGMSKEIGEGLSAIIAAIGLLLSGWGLNEAAQITHSDPKHIEQAFKNPKIVEKARQVMKDKPGNLMPSKPTQPTQPPQPPTVPSPAPVKKETPSKIEHPVIELAKKLVEDGFRVGSHAKFELNTGYHPEGKQPIGTHSPNSHHYRGQALDISAKGKSVGEMNRIFDELYANRQNYGIKELIWKPKGFYKEKGGKDSFVHNSKVLNQHANHIHVAWGGSGDQMASTETETGTVSGGATLPKGRNPKPYVITPEIKAQTVEVLNRIAAKYGLDEEGKKMLFIARSIENGGPGLEFGVGDGNPNHEARRFGELAAKGCKLAPDGRYIVVDIEAYVRSLSVQAEWSAGTIAKRFSRDKNTPLDKRIEAFAKHYCNVNWSNWKRMALGMWNSVFDRFEVA